LGDALRFGIEAGSAFGWDRWLGPGGVFVGCEDDGSAADLTPEAIAAIVRDHLVTDRLVTA
jgi:transketolase